ncbi:Holliday junction resolvase RuvX [Desulforamulus hydrothermalis]|uniref:Putative pre-16S rRNA nuclease n=1 Tax=Desulforamulus hydrothermalis Lam5 = DSM 18033 TaxID=1121428 RepID=K8E030_9FIRM|nr:Holliday junction resolvase RuvX [Desulforamulus hydrothermalis]CCO08812.1 Holliday junction resolvase [Desulforamulus hydrothermalis Lam5 = DSM 18033]SHG72205.1 putative holliday junction resolvase [Desulforamulus hydrothermalis Lam5 = DSM 18033]
MRIMGLDVGEKNIGVALSDPMGWTAQGLEVIRRQHNDKDFARLQEIIKEYGVEKILVGLPKNMNDTLGPQGEKVLAFIEELKARVDLPIQTWDERLSSVAAEKLLIQADVSRKKRKQVIDKLAAAVILQCYLDARAK